MKWASPFPKDIDTKVNVADEHGIWNRFAGPTVSVDIRYVTLKQFDKALHTHVKSY